KAQRIGGSRLVRERDESRFARATLSAGSYGIDKRLRLLNQCTNKSFRSFRKSVPNALDQIPAALKCLIKSISDRGCELIHRLWQLLTERIGEVGDAFHERLRCVVEAFGELI